MTRPPPKSPFYPHTPLPVPGGAVIMNSPSRSGFPADLAAATYDIALAEGVDPVLAFRLVRVESGFNPRAKSREGALGLTQVLPSTARQIGRASCRERG